jgi:trehalose-phosphatase
MGSRHHQKAVEAHMTAPIHALAGWKQISAEIHRGPRLALFSDFDGTLVRIRRRPEQAVLSGRLRRLLAAIARSGALLGIVSGRGIADVRFRVGLRGIWYVGAHGFFILSPGNRLFVLATRKERESIRRIERYLARNLRGLPGIWLEPKVASVAVHYRAAPHRSAARAERLIGDLQTRYPGVSLLPGKKVWELLPNARTDKWAAIEHILHRVRPRRKGRRWVSLYLGDDVTDERVFLRMTGISIAVGKKHRTAARFYLRSPAEVARFFQKLQEVLL